MNEVKTRKPGLARDWDSRRGTSSPDCGDAVERAVPGDSDRDGK